MLGRHNRNNAPFIRSDVPFINGEYQVAAMSPHTFEPIKQSQDGRRTRADAQRNFGLVIEAAKAVFATDGVDAPVRLIAERAGIGMGTLYRHFPKRSDLIVAVFRHEIDACAALAPELSKTSSSEAALTLWVDRYVQLVATKIGLGAALHSGDAAYSGLYEYFETTLRPALASLLKAAAMDGLIRDNVDPTDLMLAIARVSGPIEGPDHTYSAESMVALLLDGLFLRSRSGRPM